jgi:hypothetical protein
MPRQPYRPALTPAVIWCGPPLIPGSGRWNATNPALGESPRSFSPTRLRRFASGHHGSVLSDRLGWPVSQRDGSTPVGPAATGYRSDRPEPSL